MTHLYQAHDWQRLFEVLDTVQYGRARIGDDLSTRSYAQDLDLGRQAASWEGWTLEEGIALLPCLWRYTLLRCSLTTRADRYPLAVFQLLVLLKRKQEALGLAELLTNPAKKVRALLQITKQLREQSDQEKEWLALLLRAGEIARTIEGSSQRGEALANLATALAQAQQWDQAQAVIGTIEDSRERAWALAALGAALAQAQQWDRAQAVWDQAQAVIGMIQGSRGRGGEALANLATALAQAQQWDQAQAVIGMIQDSFWQVQALRNLATEMAGAGEDEALLQEIHHWWRLADNREYILGLFPMVTSFIPRNPELGFALYDAFTWVDSFFLKG